MNASLLEQIDMGRSRLFLEGYRNILRLDAEEEKKQQLVEAIVSAIADGYTSGIDALLSYQLEKGKLFGRFQDGDRTFAYTLAGNEISYWEVKDAPRTDSLAPSVWRADKSTKKKAKGRKCNVGIKCGNSCINSRKTCRIEPSPEAKKSISTAKKIASNVLGETKKAPSVSKPRYAMSEQERIETASDIIEDRIDASPEAARRYAESIEYFTGYDYDIMRRLESGGGRASQDSDDQYDRATRNIKSINEYMEKSPKFEGEVSRGLYFSNKTKFDSFMSSIEGGTLELNAMSSFSGSLDVARNFATGDGLYSKSRDKGAEAVVIRARNKSGVNIADVSRYAEEEEVLVPKGTRYRVTRTSRGSDGITYIDIEEDSMSSRSDKKEQIEDAVKSKKNPPKERARRFVETDIDNFIKITPGKKKAKKKRSDKGFQSGYDSIMGE